MKKYLFLLCPPYSGSTVLWKLIQTSPNVSALPTEGQFVDSVRHILLDERWRAAKEIPWDVVKEKWEEAWDLDKPILLEKSPPHLLRAFEIEQSFRESYFIAMVRNPYAFCEGRNRRYGHPMKDNAEHWVRCAEYQIKNIKGLRNVTHFTYEDFTENLERVASQVLEFIPELQTLNIDLSFEVNSILGKKPRKIENLNDIKITRLSSKSIVEINDVLQCHRDVMSFFDYEYIQPACMSLSRRITSYITVKASRVETRLHRLRSKGVQRFSGSLKK